MSFWLAEYDWLADCRQLSIIASCCNLVSCITITAGLVKIKQWINIEYGGIRVWKWSVDGLFLLYLLFLLLLTVADFAILYWVMNADSDEVYAKV